MSYFRENNIKHIFLKRLFFIFVILFLLICLSPPLKLTNAQSEREITNSVKNSSSIPTAETTIPIDVVFVGFQEEYIDYVKMDNELKTSAFYEGIDSVWNENTEEYDPILNLEITLTYDFHFASASYISAIDSFIATNSWNGYTSALNTSQLNLQEETGERMSIFYQQEGRAINGSAVEKYLAENKGYVSDEPSYTIYFLNQSKYDSPDHSFEHWFEIDEIDPDSNVTANWWRLEWDNVLNPDVEFPYPCWGFQNRLYFIDPYCHQWYTKWTDIWWNPDINEGDFDYLTVDLDTYLTGHIPGSVDYISHLTTYLLDYLNDIVLDVGGRGDGLLYNQREISAQILIINDETTHGYSKEELEWIFHEEVAEEAFEYVVPNNVATITLEDSWIELSNNPTLEGIIDYYTLGVAELGSYPWYRSDWRYLDGISIFYAFQSVAENYFDLEKGGTTFTSWILLMQNISMVSQTYGGEYKEFTGLGGGGNVVCFKDLNRYFASDGTTPRSGLTTLLVHEIGHVLGFLHAEITNDADEGAGGHMRDVMSYYAEGTTYFSVYLKDALYRTSSFVAYYRNIEAIESYRENTRHNATYLEIIDGILSDGETALQQMEYLEAFLIYRQLYELAYNIDEHLLPSKASIQYSFLTLPFVLLLIIAVKRRRSA